MKLCLSIVFLKKAEKFKKRFFCKIEQLCIIIDIDEKTQKDVTCLGFFKQGFISRLNIVGIVCRDRAKIYLTIMAK